MLSAERVKLFLRDTLGCSCPDEVFRAVDVRRAVRLNSFIVLDSALVVGDRLLVYVVEAGAEGCVEEHLPVLVNAGRAERDIRGLNRFRLVLVADDPGAIARTAERLFEDLRGMDQKVHLHIICTQQKPFAADADETTGST